MADKNICILPVGGEWIKTLASEKIKPLAPFNPSWSPDGKRIAFRANNSGLGDLFIINTENGLFRCIYSSECHNGKKAIHAAEWSPEGEALAFEAPDPTSAENNIYMALVDKKSVKLLGKGFRPEWSPDGRRIFCQTEEGEIRIFDTGISSYNGTRIYPPFFSRDFLKVVYTNPVTKEAWIANLERKENIFLTSGKVDVLGWLDE